VSTRTGIERPVRAGLRDRSGFTLIELIVVLLILSVVAGVTVPALFTPPPAVTEMEEAVGRLDTLFRLARDSAVRSASTVTVVMDSISGLVWFDLPGTSTDESPDADATAGLSTTAETPFRPRTGDILGGGSTLGRGLGDPGATLQATTDAQPLTLPEGIRIEYFHLRSRFTFTPGGSAMADSLRLRSTLGQTCLITIDPWSGRVRAY
jgi:prepilin-type N-terminal cleavage/methylation domain-containing protein